MTTKAEALLFLAERGVGCPIYHSANIEPPCIHSSLHCPMCICHGTGRVPMFPTLRRRCADYGRDSSLVNAHCNEDGVVDDCPFCQGRGWVVTKVPLEDWLAMAEKAGYDLRVSPGLIHLVAHDGNWHRLVTTSSERVMEDVALALVAAVEAQEEAHDAC